MGYYLYTLNSNSIVMAMNALLYSVGVAINSLAQHIGEAKLLTAVSPLNNSRSLCLLRLGF